MLSREYVAMRHVFVIDLNDYYCDSSKYDAVILKIDRLKHVV